MAYSRYQLVTFRCFPLKFEVIRLCHQCSGWCISTWDHLFTAAQRTKWAQKYEAIKFQLLLKCLKDKVFPQISWTCRWTPLMTVLTSEILIGLHVFSALWTLWMYFTFTTPEIHKSSRTNLDRNHYFMFTLWATPSIKGIETREQAHFHQTYIHLGVNDQSDLVLFVMNNNSDQNRPEVVGRHYAFAALTYCHTGVERLTGQLLERF